MPENCEYCGEPIGRTCRTGDRGGSVHPECDRAMYQVKTHYLDTVVELCAKDNTFEVPDDAEVKLGENGAWVKVWLWIPEEIANATFGSLHLS